MTTLHIDTDLGVDDALALFVASRIPGVRIAAISTVFGNVPLASATRNARLMREVLGLDRSIPILAGASAPSGSGFARDARSVHGDDGLGGATSTLDPAVLDAAARPAALDGELKGRISVGPPAHLAPGERVSLVGLGPATNIAALIDWYGPALSRVVLMSGVFFDRGNVAGVAEFNAACDPAALRDTLAEARMRRLPAALVPLDLCRKVQLASDTIRDWSTRDPSPATRFLTAAHAHYVGVYRDREGIDGCFPHDTIAVLASVWPGPFHALAGDVTVGADGCTRWREAPGAATDVLTGGDLAWLRTGLAALRFKSPP